MPDRGTETVANWLKEHPGVEVVTRDRFFNFAKAVKQGAPNAISIADRWHLLNNLHGIVKRLLARNGNYLKETRQDEIAKELNNVLSAKEQKTKQHFDNTSIHYKKFVELKRMLAEGYTCARVARELKLNRQTVFRWRKHDVFPRRQLKPRIDIEPVEAYIRERLAEEPGISITELWGEIRA